MAQAVLTPTGFRVDDLDAGGVLAALGDSRAAEDAAAARTLLLAATWADLHPALEPGSAASFWTGGSDYEEPIAGDGCPGVEEFAVAELGAVAGLSTTAAKKLIGHALELRHRLPRLWALVQEGRVPAWRARLVAEATIHACPRLTPDAAGWVDGQVAAVAGKVGPTQLDRLVTEAITRHRLLDPDQDPALDPDEGLYTERRHVTFHHDAVGYTGTVDLTATLDLADALDLDHTLAQHAAALQDLGSTAPLDARRAIALGDLARTQTVLDLTTGSEEPATQVRAARELVLHLHLSAEAVDGDGWVLGPTGRLEEGQRLVLLDQVKAWTGDTHTRVTLRPVIDLNTQHTAPGYAIPDRLRDQVILRDRTCRFPWCPRPARRCDLDHVTPYDHHAATEGRAQPGPTTTSNLQALCRFHHRLKTHTAWRVVQPRSGVLVWTSPHGHRYRVDSDGTTPLPARHIR